MTQSYRFVFLALAIAVCGGSGVASAQLPPPTPVTPPTPIPIDDVPACAPPTLVILQQPAVTNGQRVTTEIQWGNNTGIKEVKMRMLRKDDDGNYTVEVGTTNFETMAVSAKAVKIVGPTDTQPANTKVKIEIKTYAMDGTLIKTKVSDVVTLP